MKTTLDRHIEITPVVRGGKPRIAITHLRLGQSLSEIAKDYRLPLSAAYAAMAYYYDHRDEIDRRVAKAEAFAEEFRRNHPSIVPDMTLG